MTTPIETAINAVLQPIPGVQPTEEGLPCITHSGVLELVPGLRLNVYRTSDGRAIVDQESMDAFLEFLEQGV